MQENETSKQSTQSISTPQEMSRYLRVSSPSVWFILIAILLFLAGALVWGFWGRLETTDKVAVIAENGVNVSYVRADIRRSVSRDTIVRIDSKQYRVTGIAQEPIRVEDLPAIVLSLGEYPSGTYVYKITLSGSAIEDIQDGEIVLESIAPISFLLNSDEEDDR